MSQALEVRAISSFGPSSRAAFDSSAPPVGVFERTKASEPEKFAATGAKLDALEISPLDLRGTGAARPFGLGAAASLTLHLAFFVGALLWSQSRTERAPEPIAVEIVVEQAPLPASEPISPPAPEPVPTPVAETPPPTPEPILSPTPEPIPTPVAETPPPAPEPIPSPTPESLPAPVAVTPPSPDPAPLPSPIAVAKPPPVVETPPTRPKPVAKIELPKPTPAPKKLDHAQTPTKPQPVATRNPDASTASSSRAASLASSASLGEYRDTVYARIRARQHFPESARESGAHGTTELSFGLDDVGQVRSIAIVKSSGEAALDADALATVRRSAPFGPPPPGASRDFAVKLRYALQ